MQEDNFLLTTLLTIDNDCITRTDMLDDARALSTHLHVILAVQLLIAGVLMTPLTIPRKYARSRGATL